MKKIISRSILASLLLSALFTFTGCEEITKDELKCKFLRDREACLTWEMQNFEKDLNNLIKKFDQK